MHTPTAVIYARISQDRTGAGLGVERQVEDCRALAARLGWTVVEVFDDNDISAYSGRRRPAYQRMLERLERGDINGVLCWHTDRLHRSPVELEEYVELSERHGITTHSVKAGELDLSTPAGRMVARMLGATARYESEHKAERIARKREQAAAAGQWAGGPRPFGWRIEKQTDDHGHTVHVPVIVEEEADLVRWANEAVLRGASFASVVAHFTDSGVPPARGGRWHHNSIRAILRRSRNCGIESLKGQEVGRSTFPPIVDERTWRAVQRKLADPNRKTVGTNRTKHLLSMIAQCRCGRPVTSNTSGYARADGSRRTVYACTNARRPKSERLPGPHVSLAQEALDAYVNDAMPSVIALPWGPFRLHHQGELIDVIGLEAELEDLRAQKAEAAEMWLAGEIDRAQLAAMNRSLQEKIDAAEKQLGDAAEEREGLPDLSLEQAREFWNGLDILGKRAVLRQAVTITLLPTGGRQWAKLPDGERSDYVRIEGRQVAEVGGVRTAYYQPTVPDERELEED